MKKRGGGELERGFVTYRTMADLRAWLSQWSLDHSNADGLKSAASVSVPLLAIENSADDAVPQPHVRMIHDAAASRDKTFRVIKGATHYYQGQPEHLAQAVELCAGWLRECA